MGGSPLPVSLFGLLPEDLELRFADLGLPISAGLARRIVAFAVAGGDRDWSRMRQLPREVRELLESHFSTDRLEVVERVRDSGDGFVKYLLRSPDGSLSEAVRIPLHREGRYSICLSSQVGCAMACVFCATGRLGLTRHLEPWEIVAAWRTVADDLSDGRISSAVFMGQGEPFHNYDAVIQTARILSDPCGGRISKRSISISTVGLVPQIRRFTREGHPYRLFVSLTSADPEHRRLLLPVAGRTPMSELVDALRSYHEATDQPITLAWVLLGGVNSDPTEVDRIRDLFGDLPVIVNLIDVNDARDDDGFRRATPTELDAFRDALSRSHLAFRRRYSGGRNKHAACGMLAATHQRKIESDSAQA